MSDLASSQGTSSLAEDKAAAWAVKSDSFQCRDMFQTRFLEKPPSLLVCPQALRDAGANKLYFHSDSAEWTQQLWVN